MGSLYYLCSFNIPCPSVTANMETPELVFVLFFGEGGEVCPLKVLLSSCTLNKPLHLGRDGLADTPMPSLGHCMYELVWPV